ncbi:MAG: hypothetical protein OEV94_02690 [Deltaproteobacteria bacterium]|nr:hypothetical protein [Deltaproteobacteria bacterium]
MKPEKQNNKRKVCKFCGETKNNFPNSHVIPHFLLKQCFDPEDKHRASVFRGNSQGGKEGLEQKNKKGNDVDNNLLCHECETIFQQWEGPASKVLYTPDGSQRIHKVERKEDIGLTYEVASALDYPTMKLFILSILWRLSVSTISIAKRVNLGPHEKTIKEILLKKAPGADTTYPIVIYKVIYNNEHPFFYSTAFRYRLESRNCVCIFGGGYMFGVSMSNQHKIPDHFLIFRIKSDGSAMIPYRDAMDFPEIKKLIKTPH